jgi:hypothetical protein
LRLCLTKIIAVWLANRKIAQNPFKAWKIRSKFHRTVQNPQRTFQNPFKTWKIRSTKTLDRSKLGKSVQNPFNGNLVRPSPDLNFAGLFCLFLDLVQYFLI